MLSYQRQRKQLSLPKRQLALQIKPRKSQPVNLSNTWHRATLLPNRTSVGVLESRAFSLLATRYHRDRAVHFSRDCSGEHKLLRAGRVPTLFWRWLTVSSVFTGRRARTSYSYLPPTPHPVPPSSVPSPVPNKPYVVFVDFSTMKKENL